MKVGEIIELSYEGILRGRLGRDVNVMRTDIRAFLPAAINESILQEYLTEKRFGAAKWNVPDQFIKTFEGVAVKYNRKRDVRYIDLPEIPIAFMEDMGLNSILPMKGDIEFYYLKNRSQLSSYEQYTNKNVYYWREGLKAYFKNLSPATTEVLVLLISSFSNFKDEDEAPIPMGMENTVITAIINHFLGQAQPADEKENMTNGQDNKQQG